MTALALRDDQTEWDANQLAVLRSTGIDEDVSKPELSAFLHECQRRRLDPFTRQIYLLGRYDRQKNRKVYRSQTSIDGFRLISRRAADEAKESIEYEDTLWCGDDGQWADVWLSQKPPAACKVVVRRNGKRFPATARYDGYVQVNSRDEAMGLWRKMPDNQLAKCAEALALRKAFPEELGSLYTDDEMAQADNPQAPVQATATTVREERAPSESEWEVRSAEGAAWLASATATAASAPDVDALRKLWTDTAAHLAAGAITQADADQIAALMKARSEDLAANAADDGDVVEGVVVEELPPDNPWAATVAEIQTPEEGARALADLDETAKASDMTAAQHNKIKTAIEARCAGLGEAVAV